MQIDRNSEVFGMAAGFDASDPENKVAQVPALNVKSLQYVPSIDLVRETRLFLANKMHLAKWLPSHNVFNREYAELHDVSFCAVSGKITAVVGPSDTEVLTLLSLIGTKTRTGGYDGEIALVGATPGTTYLDNFAYISDKTPYVPGFTYYDIVYYSASLRLAGTYVDIKKRVDEIMDLMDLNHCKYRVIPEYPPTHGELGRDLRLLSIAAQIVHLPLLIVVHNPAIGLHAGVAMKIFECLRRLASRGHVVLCSLLRTNPLILSAIDEVVVLSEGRSIFASGIENIEKYFTSKELGYVLKQDVNPVDFAVDIAAGLERPESSREAPIPSLLQERFEASQYFRPIQFNGFAPSAFSPEMFRFYGYGYMDPLGKTLSRTMTTIQRAVMSKLKDKDPLVRYIGSSIVPAVIVSYLQWNQGSYGYYTMSLLFFPYLNTMNLTSLFFFIPAFVFTQQIVNVHVICQKLQVFRYEQNNRTMTTAVFCATSLLSEVPFCLLGSTIFGTITFFMTTMNYGHYNYTYYIMLLFMISLVGMVSGYLYSTILRREIVVRDTFFLTIFFMVILSGFPFQLTSVPDEIAHISKANPLRWAFEALMVWKFGSYKDGYYYLNEFGFENFHKEDVFRILGHFIWIESLIFILLSFPLPNFMKRISSDYRPSSRSSRNESRDSMDDSSTKSAYRFSETVKPVIFSRESSVTQKSRLSVNLSQVGENVEGRGPTVTFSDISYRITDHFSPQGYKSVLDNVSGQFEWGKLNIIMGGANSGKTTLLHILAGNVSASANIQGIVRYNRNAIDQQVPLWKRCALVDAHDEQHRDLTVKQVIRFAAMLRCGTFDDLKLVEENVNRTIEILHLQEVANIKSKKVSPGERRRLSIAEELVQGPLLLFVDEITNNMDPLDESVLLMTCRELVNQDRTVVCTCSKPSAAAFSLFDSLLLLSKGRVIFHGAASFAIRFFADNPYRYDITPYINNPGEFLVNISSGTIFDDSRNVIETSVLETYYKKSDLFVKLSDRITKVLHGQSGSVGSTQSDKTSLSKALTTDTIIIESGLAKKPIVDTFKISAFFTTVILPFFIWKKGDLSSLVLKCYTLLYRETLGLICRYTLVLGSCILHMFLGCMFGWVVGNDATTEVYNATSFFAVGTLTLLLCNIYFILYIYRTNLVILKEHSRGLFTNFEQWLVCSLPLYVLRAVNIVIFCLIAYHMLGLPTNAETYGYYVASMICVILASTMMTEFVVQTVPDLRSGYLIIPAFVFMQFGFSALFIKPASLPSWLAPWAPSISMIRWNLQGNFMNQFGNEQVLITLPNGYSLYSAFLQLFGWGGKSKWFCFNAVLLFILVFKGLSFISMGVAFLYHTAGRRLKNAIEE